MQHGGDPRSVIELRLERRTGRLRREIILREENILEFGCSGHAAVDNCDQWPFRGTDRRTNSEAEAESDGEPLRRSERFSTRKRLDEGHIPKHDQSGNQIVTTLHYIMTDQFFDMSATARMVDD
jgi:hypothetical protein